MWWKDHLPPSTEVSSSVVSKYTPQVFNPFLFSLGGQSWHVWTRLTHQKKQSLFHNRFLLLADPFEGGFFSRLDTLHLRPWNSSSYFFFFPFLLHLLISSSDSRRGSMRNGDSIIEAVTHFFFNTFVLWELSVAFDDFSEIFLVVRLGHSCFRLRNGRGSVLFWYVIFFLWMQEQTGWCMLWYEWNIVNYVS